MNFENEGHRIMDLENLENLDGAMYVKVYTETGHVWVWMTPTCIMLLDEELNQIEQYTMDVPIKTMDQANLWMEDREESCSINNKYGDWP